MIKKALEWFSVGVALGAACGLIIVLGVMAEKSTLSWVAILLIAMVILYLFQGRDR